MIKRRKRFGIATVRTTLFFLSLFLLPSFTLAQTRPEVEWQEGRLSIHAESIPLSQIIKEIAHHTGLEIQGAEELQEKVSFHFADLSLSEGIQKLLAHVNYFLLEEASPQGNKRPTRVLVFGQRAAPSSEEKVNAEEEAVASGNEEGDRLAKLQETIQTGGIEAEEALQSAAFDPAPNIQTLALETLAEQNPQEAQRTFFKALSVDNPLTRLTAVQVASQETDTALPILTEALSDSDRDVKGYAMSMLAQQGSQDAVLALGQILHDPDPTFRQVALELFSQMGDPTSLSYLNLALNDEDEAVRNTAADLLSRAERKTQ